SRRRHTRSKRDWSSDVCSSDLPQADVQGDLVVAAAAGVQPLARVADAGGEGLLNKGMDILGGGVDLQRAGMQVGQDALETLVDEIGRASCRERGKMSTGDAGDK